VTVSGAIPCLKRKETGALVPVTQSNSVKLPMALFSQVTKIQFVYIFDEIKMGFIGYTRMCGLSISQETSLS
jgi:hypothetical protein